jgi:hypothetical protein
MLAAAAVFCCAAAASADVKVKTRNSFGGPGGQSTESTVYIKGKRQRMESQGGVANVTQCDLRRTLMLNGMTKTYTVSSWDEGDTGGETRPATAAGPAQPVRKGGVVTTTVTTTDTGERKQMFGYTARRIKTSMVTESSPEACSPVKSRIDTDGWYIDLAIEFDCGDRAASGYTQRAEQGGCRDEHRMKQIGSAKLGYPAMVTTTMYDQAGQPSYTMTQEVLEISKATLDAALFDVPADYRQVKDASEMYSAGALAAAAGQGLDNGSSAGTKSSPSANTGDDDDDAGAANSMKVNAPSTQGMLAVGPKQPGMVRVGVVTTKATAAEGMDSNALAEAIRNTLIGYLRGPAVEIVALDASVPMQVEAEARQKECDYVIHTTATHKKGGGGGFGGFMKKAAPVVGAVPVGGIAGSAGGAAAAHATTTAVYTAAHVAGSVKAKDELTLEYTLQKAGTAVASNKLKAKANSDGEDIISRLAEQVATVVLAQAAAK